MDLLSRLSALRRLRPVQRPGLWVGAALSLSIAFAGALAVFTVVERVLMNPLPYPDPDRIVMVRREQGVDGVGPPVSGPAFLDLMREQRVFSAFAAYENGNAVLTGSGAAQRVASVRLTGQWFDVAGLAPAMGRFFQGAEVPTIAADEVVLSHAAWRDLMGAAPDAVGRLLMLDGRAHRVVAVAPASLELPGRAAIALPLAMPAGGGERGFNRYLVHARIRPELGLEQAQAQLTQLAEALARQHPDNHEGLRLRAVPLAELVVRSTERVTSLLLAGIVLLILVGAASLSNLLLADAETRRREFATRIALGAHPRRLARMLVLETTAAAAVAALLGILLGQVLVRLLADQGGSWIAYPERLQPGPWSMLAVFAVALLVALVAALLTARTVHRSAGDGSSGLRARSGTPDRAGMRSRRVLVAVQIALCFVLLLGAGLLGKSLRQVLDEDPGFDPTGVWTAHLALPAKYRAQGTDTPEDKAVVERAARFLAEVEAAVQGLPGVSSAGFVLRVPVIDGAGFNGDIRIGGPGGDDASVERRVEYQQASPTYFRAMGLDLLSGRLLDTTEPRDDLLVVNDALEQQWFGGASAVGRRLVFGDGVEREIVGVVRGPRQNGLVAEVRPELYLSFGAAQLNPDVGLVVRSTLDPALITDSIRRRIAEIDADVPLYLVKPLSVALAESTAPRRFLSVVTAGFAFAALAIAAVSLHALLSQMLLLRSQEFGVRLALGATGAHLRRLIAREGVSLVALGLAAGAAVAASMTQVVRGLLYEVSAGDPWVGGQQALLLLAIAAAAVAPVVWRAARVAPMAALREE